MAGMIGRFRTTRLPPPTRHSLTCGGETVVFLWVRGRGRRLRLEVREDGEIRVHSPAQAGADAVLSFVAGKAAWILRTRAKALARRRLTWPEDRREQARLRTECERRLQERLEACLPLAAAHNLPRPAVSFRMMKRRWGSCARDGRIVLNVRLAQLPPACIDYVILHELCHLRHHHHGRPFYDLLARLVPDGKERRTELARFRIA